MNKTTCIVDALNKELEKIETELDDKNTYGVPQQNKEAYKKKLIRYKKFFKYRNKDLEYRENVDIDSLEKELLADLEFLDNQDAKKGLTNFFEMYNEDTLGASIGFVLKSMKEMGQDCSALLNRVVKLNELLFGKNNKRTSYLYAAYRDYIEAVERKLSEVSKYITLRRLVNERNSYAHKKTDVLKTDLARSESKKSMTITH